MDTITPKFHDYPTSTDTIKTRVIPARDLYDLTRTNRVNAVDAIVVVEDDLNPRHAEPVQIIHHTDWSEGTASESIIIRALWGGEQKVAFDAPVKVIALVQA